MRVGIFGGSFDPVHREHVRLAAQAIEKLRLDKLLIMPAYVPPHKPGKELSPNADRLEMCRLAFAEVEKAEVSDYEIQKQGVSYTYLTCRALKEQYENSELFWLVGTDMLRDFPSWREPDDILQNATLAVCGRGERGEWLQAEEENFYRRFRKKFFYLDYNAEDVSSTQVRVLAGAGLRLTEIVPEKVAEYIEKRGLYKIPRANEALALEKPSRAAHSLRVAYLAAKKAVAMRISERKAIAASLFHDCAKNLTAASPHLEGFSLPSEWGEVPPPVWHQFAGAYVAEHAFGVTDGDILNAVRYHTSGRPNMSELEKLVFLADMLEEERSYEGVDLLRALFWKEGLDECLKKALEESVIFIEKKGGTVYPLTRLAYQFYEQSEV